MTLSPDVAQSSPILTWEELHNTLFTLTAPFQLPLQDNNIFIGYQILRIVPKRRLIAYGTWNGKSVVAKLFFNHKRGKQLFDKEITGTKFLKENNILTPDIYYQGTCVEGKIYVILYERIFKVKTLDQVWRKRTSIDNSLSLIHSMLIKFANQHEVGIEQHDCNLRNYLLSEDKIYAIDCSLIELHPAPLTKEICIKNLGQFFSKLGIEIESYAIRFLHFYAEYRGLSLTHKDHAALLFYINFWGKHNWKRKQKRIYSNCAEFSVINHKMTGVYDRSYNFPEFMKFLKNPEIFLKKSQFTLLKSDKFSSLMRIALDKHEFLIRQYNHVYNPVLYSSKANQLWKLTQKLYYFQVPINKPVAYIEKRKFGFITQSYFISEYLPFEPIPANEGIIERISTLIKQMSKLISTHFKITDFLMNEKEQVLLIDLDKAVNTTMMSRWLRKLNPFFPSKID